MIVTGGIFMATRNVSSNNPTFENYSSTDEELNLTMDYISDWEYREHRGSYDSYAQVQFYGARKDGIAPSIIVTMKRTSKVSFEPVTIGGLADDLIKKRMLFEDAQVVSKADAEILGYPAVDLTLSYKQLNKLHSIDASPISIQERVFILKKEDKFYTVRYVNPQKEFGAFEKAFLHSISTFKIKN